MIPTETVTWNLAEYNARERGLPVEPTLEQKLERVGDLFMSAWALSDPRLYQAAMEAARELRYGGSAVVQDEADDIAERLESAIREHRAYAAEAEEKGDLDLKRLHVRALNANVKALHHWNSGVRPVEVRRGWYTVPSATTAGQVYLTSPDECTCPHHQHRELAFCWHNALVTALEMARNARALRV